MSLALEKTTDGDWNSVRRNFLEIETDWDRNRTRNQVFDFTSSAGPFNLGNFDGESIQGVRIIMSGRLTSSAGLNLYLVPNGLTTIQSGGIYIWEHYNSPGVTGASAGYDVQTQDGLYTGYSTQWVAAGEMLDTEILFLCREGPGGASSRDPMIITRSISRDDTSDIDRVGMGRASTNWSNGGPVTSLALKLTAGGSNTFTGRITTEIIP